MKYLLITIFSISTFFSYSQSDSEILDKMKNLKELYEMEVISKREYDSITKILVNNLVNQKSEIKLQSNNQNSNNTNIQPSISNNEQLNSSLSSDSNYTNLNKGGWGLGISYGSGDIIVGFEGYEESVEATAFGIGFVNRWDYSETVKVDTSFTYAQAKSEGEKSDSFQVGSTLLLYFDDSMGVHLRASINTAFSLEEKVEDFDQMTQAVGLGLGFDVGNEFTLTVGIGKNLWNPYKGPLDIEVKSESIGAGLVFRF